MSPFGLAFRNSAFLLLVLTAGRVGAETPLALNWQTDYVRAHEMRVAAGRPMLVFVTMDGCPFCEEMLRTTYQDPSVADEIADRYVPTVVNGSRQQALATQFGVRIYPTTFLIAADNRVIDKIEGFVAPEDFRRRIATAKVRFASVPDRHPTR